MTQGRSFERQEFLEDLKREVARMEGEHGPRFKFLLATTLLDLLRKGDLKLCPQRAEEKFLQEVLPKLERFIRAREEKSAILIGLLKYLVATIDRGYQMDLTTADREKCEEILHADPTTAQVEL